MSFFKILKNKIFKTENEKENIQKYDAAFDKTRKNINQIFSSSKKNLDNLITEDYFLQLEEALILSDIGIMNVTYIVNELKKIKKNKKIKSIDDINNELIKLLEFIYNNNVNIKEDKDKYTKPFVYLFVGINGAGKTTTIAKIAYKLKQENNKVLIVAGDTFRAAAVEQLNVWSKKVGVDILLSKNTNDSSGVIYDGIKKGIQEQYDYILCDTAGRLQNKVNLMKELEKITRVIKKQLPKAPDETFLVIDATTGQNGIIQAKKFKEIANVTSIVLTKMDGTAKGGIAFAISKELNIPIKYIGLGEKTEDLDEFDIKKYLYGVFGQIS